MADITAVILTRNEELFIGKCIASIQKVVKRIVVVDSYSEDRTVEIAESMGAEVISHAFVNYAKQFQYAVDVAEIRTTWVLRIDADERFSEKSALEIDRLCNENQSGEVNGFVLRYVNVFMGKKIYHGGLYPFAKLAVYRNGTGQIEDRNMDEHIIINSGTVIACKEDGEHFVYRNLDFFVRKHNWYSSREARDYFEQKKADSVNSEKKTRIKMNYYYKLPMFFRAKLYYIYRYYILRGFLDGAEGKILAVMQAYWYRFLVDAKIYEHLKTGEDFAKLGPLN